MKIHIYSIVNRINGKTYYGKTKRSIEKRFDGHVRSANKGSTHALKRAIRKYGPKNFSIKLICCCYSNTSANKKERLVIRIAREKNAPLYNMTDGGDGLVGYKFTKEQRKMLSQKISGRSMTWANKIHATLRKSPEIYEQWKKKISNGMKQMSESRKLMRRKNICLAYARIPLDKKNERSRKISLALKKAWKRRRPT